MFLGIVYILGAIVMSCFATVLILLIKKQEAKNDLNKVAIMFETICIIFLMAQGAAFFFAAFEILFSE